MNPKIEIEVEHHLYETRNLLRYLAYKTEKKQPSSINTDVVEDLDELVLVLDSHDYIIKEYLYLLQKAGWYHRVVKLDQKRSLSSFILSRKPSPLFRPTVLSSSLSVSQAKITT